MGRVPPDATGAPMSASPVRVTRNAETSLLPAFTTYRRRWSFVRITDPWLPRPPPVPVPPVAYVAAGVSWPSAARSNTMAELPPGALVIR
jgi:hypothetical protein